jgi:TolB-like protein/DNA-binding winged helix-turn-helix (wHTH) protein
MDVSIKDKGVYAFGRFRLDAMRRTLLCGDVPIKLVPRLFDLLLYLIENPGRVVEKDELLNAVWGGRIVEEANLSQAISALRKVLQTDASDAMIVTAPGRGYRFTAPVSLESGVWPLQSRAAQTEDVADISVASPPEPRGRAPWWRNTTTLLPVALSAMVVGAGLIAWHSRPAGLTSPRELSAFAPPPHSIAVLAFTNMSGDPGQDYFTDGLSTELIDALGRIDGVRVAARTSAFSFKGGHATIGDIGRTLNVGAVLEGSVRRDGTRLRISADLTDTSTGFQLWSHQYDRDQGDVLQVQSEIASAVTGVLQIKLLGDQQSLLSLGGTTNGRAFDAYLRGLGLYARGLAYFQASVAADEQALALDPGYALAYASRAHTLCEIADMSGNLKPDQMQRLNETALQSARRAVSLAPGLGVAHAQLAWVMENCTFDFAGADAEISRAVALAPGNADVLDTYAYLQMYGGHADEAISASRRMVALDPVNAYRYMDLAVMFYDARRFDEAEAALRHTDSLDGYPSIGLQDLRCMIALAKGDLAAAVAASAGEHHWNQNMCLAVAYHRMGKQQEADAQAAKVHALLGDTGPFQYAMMAAQWGDKAGAVRWLQAAYKLRDPGILGMNTEFMLDPIHDTPEFKGVARLVFGSATPR